MSTMKNRSAFQHVMNILKGFFKNVQIYFDSYYLVYFEAFGNVSKPTGMSAIRECGKVETDLKVREEHSCG